MEKTTVLARLRVTLNLNPEVRKWLRHFPDSWFAREEGSAFLSEFGGTWERLFVDSAQPEIQAYFQELGVPGEHLPYVRPGERYQGSWVLDATVVMAGAVGTAYAILKGISELPDIADGLAKLKQRIIKRFRPQADSSMRENLITAATSGRNRPELMPVPPPNTVAEIDLVIDARPILSLTPALLKQHRLHLSVGVSRDSFTLENLGDEPMRDVRLGLFRTATERHQWSYQDAYMGDVPWLSPRQTIAKRLGEFRDRLGNRLDMSDGEAAFVDCWVEDKFGIYLFRFYLEKE